MVNQLPQSLPSPQAVNTMAQALLDFFDEDYFSQACTCGSGSNMEQEKCGIHGDTVGPVQHPLSGPPTQLPLSGPIENGGGSDVVPALHTHVPPIAGSDVVQIDINQSFPRQPTQEHLTMLIEYRIRVLSNHPSVIKPGETIPIQTNIKVTRKAGKLSLLLKSAEGLPLRLAEGLINPSFRGRLAVYFENPSSENVHLPAGSNVAYLILTPFI